MIVLAPVYQPGHRLLTLVTELGDAAPGIHVVVVDDGSSPESAPTLDAAVDRGCTVLRHSTNRGKGATGRMVLGVRGFEGAVPLRSRVGNTATRLLFRAATSRAVQDTQTGLRAYPGALLDWLQSVPGERFEYEMNVLLHAVRAGYPIDEITIATTYLHDHASSHFGSLADSARVYWPLLRFAASSLFTSTRSGR